MPASTRTRRDRNSPYLFDPFFGEIHRSAAGTIWRWRTEFGLIAVMAASGYGLALAITVIGSVTAIVVAAVFLGVIPQTRRFLMARFWCLVTRHRFQRMCWETRLHTRSGRLPLVLWIRPTEVGERAFIWCRAGISSEDFEAHTDDIRAACYARDARVARNKQRSQLVTIDVIRRDTLHATRHVKPHIIPGVAVEGTEVAASRTRVPAHRVMASIPRWFRRTPAND
jgi:hypothetical protein